MTPTSSTGSAAGSELYGTSLFNSVDSLTLTPSPKNASRKQPFADSADPEAQPLSSQQQTSYASLDLSPTKSLSSQIHSKSYLSLAGGNYESPTKPKPGTTPSAYNLSSLNSGTPPKATRTQSTDTQLWDSLGFSSDSPFPTKPPIPTQTPFSAVLCIVILGMANILPWLAFISCADYFSVIFPTANTSFVFPLLYMTLMALGTIFTTVFGRAKT
ncbi:hypothetical protein TeGR_g3098 [Tetraparma gracilis]|uniref:Uncharacterized protein n=1 Tax=Tetraparma gracilis TaxID=2962635 RepID=A0ABQ6M3V5_9STRA|nr:hypothetical protein TeGR_g3098 [Tetraparma gracilis]